jgi:hypothetical protein
MEQKYTRSRQAGQTIFLFALPERVRYNSRS